MMADLFIGAVSRGLSLPYPKEPAVLQTVFRFVKLHCPGQI